MAKKKILLVDDSNTVLLMERMVIGEDKYQLLVARNGKEAVTRALAERPDLIFMDVLMPEMDGFEACKTLRERPETHQVPIIMVTTRGEPCNVQKGFEAGCSEYITKPFNSVELVAKLKNYLGE